MLHLQVSIRLSGEVQIVNSAHQQWHPLLHVGWVIRAAQNDLLGSQFSVNLEGRLRTGAQFRKTLFIVAVGFGLRNDDVGFAISEFVLKHVLDDFKLLLIRHARLVSHDDAATCTDEGLAHQLLP